MWGFGFILRRFFTVSSNKNKKRPPFKIEVNLEGDDNGDELATAVGNALGAWTILEFQLSIVYLAAAHPHGFPMGAPAAFASVISFRGRLEMISALLVHSLDANKATHTDLIEKWEKRAKALGKLCTRRNEIAHGVSIIVRDPPRPEIRGWTPHLNYTSFVLEFADDTARARKIKKLRRLSVTEIKSAEADFQSECARLGVFAHEDVLPIMQQIERTELPRLA